MTLVASNEILTALDTEGERARKRRREKGSG
jgi:hypothetical protein